MTLPLKLEMQARRQDFGDNPRGIPVGHTAPPVFQAVKGILCLAVVGLIVLFALFPGYRKTPIAGIFTDAVGPSVYNQVCAVFVHWVFDSPSVFVKFHRGKENIQVVILNAYAGPA